MLSRLLEISRQRCDDASTQAYLALADNVVVLPI
jgi:hypothetical protein